MANNGNEKNEAAFQDKVFKPAWRSFFGTNVLMAVFFLIAVALSFIPMEGTWIKVIWCVALVIIFGLYLSIVCRRLDARFYIRDNKVEYIRGIFGKDSTRILYTDLSTTNVKQTFTQRLLNTGTLRLASSGTSGYEIEAPDLPNPEAIYSEIRAQRDYYLGTHKAASENNTAKSDGDL